jgi:hypothetical protein
MKENGMRRTIALATVVGLALALSAVGAGAETSPTRDEYRAAAEPICKANTKANERIFSGVRQQVREDKLRPAAAKFEKAAKALTKARRQLLVLPQPSADKTRLINWFGYMKEEVELFKRTAELLRDGEKSKAVRMTEELTRTGNRANAEVLGFDFVYCRFEPSKFT